MNAMRMVIALVWLSGLLPGMAQASDADRFVAASRSQQAELLTQWAEAPDALQGHDTERCRRVSQGDRHAGAAVDGSWLHRYKALERNAERRPLRGFRAA